jgi:phosphatidate cytidylyltransferase
MTLFFIYSRYFMDQTMRESVVNNQTFIVNSIAISPYAIIIYLILLFSITLFSKRFTVVDACYLFSMGLYIGFAFLAMMLVRYLPNTQAYYGKEGLASCVLASYIVIASGMNDIGAYFIGSIFGKHKMAPTISPHKTWEGFFGGFVISFASSFLFAWLIEHFAQTSSGQAVALLPGVLEFANGHVGWLVMLSLMIPIIGDIGDLLFSAIKRYYAIKDYGTLLPGHGGILDRIDSLSLVVMFVALVIAAITKGWAFLI